MHRIALVLALGVLLTGCRRHARPTPPIDAAGLFERAALAPDPALAGVSGLTRATDDADHYWAIPERFHALISLRVPRGPLAPALQKAIPLEGVPDGLDTESLAALSPTRFAAGTESTTSGRATDEILFIELQGESARVTGHLALPWTAWGEGVRAEDNRGIEALCAVEGSLWAAGEFTWKEQGARVAPLGRVDPATGAVTPYRLRLTSSTGKISALACRRDRAGALEAVAIERHYGVARILRFPLPAAPQPDPIQPTVAIDLAAVLGDVPNFEGIAWDGDDHALLISDNQMAIVIGPTVVARVRL